MFSTAAFLPRRLTLALFACICAVGAGAAPALADGPTAVTPTIFTAIQGGQTVPAGATVRDVATLGSLVGTPAGTVAFTWYENGACAGAGTAAGSASVDAAGLADGSSAEGPLAPGDYSFSAHFTSFNTDSWTDADSQCEPLHVADASVLPLTATKDALPFYARSIGWQITKSVDTSRQNVAAGSSATFDYTVTVTHDAGTDSDWQVSGEITVHNPNTAPVDGVAVSDALDDPNATCAVSGGSPTVPAGGDVVLDYTCTYSAAPASGSQTNTATVTWPAQTLSNFGSLDAGSTPAEAAVVWGGPTTIVDGSVDVNDSLVGLLDSVSYTNPDPAVYHYSYAFAGDPVGACTTHDNAATVNNDAALLASSTVTVEVCSGGRDLTVTKTATPAFTRTFGWQAAKSVDATRRTVADGGAATFSYAIDVTKGAGADSTWAVTGAITVTNPNTWDVDATLAEAAPGGDCTLDQTAVTVPASGTVSVGYTCTFAGGASGVNTATATWDGRAASTPGSSASGSAPYAFDTPTTVVADSVDVYDNGVLLGSTDQSRRFTYEKTLPGVGGTCTSYDNTAAVSTGQAPVATSNTVTVSVCANKDLAVSKTATPSFARSYAWTIAKSVAAPSTVTQSGGSASFAYTVGVAGNGFTDSSWTVAGKITLSNPNDWDAFTADVTDGVDNGGACAVAHGTGVSVPAHGSVTLDYTCTYASAPARANGLNTATATWDTAAFPSPHGSATGTAAFSFATPTTETGKTVTATDTFNGATGTLGSVTYPGRTFTYTRTAAVPALGCLTYPNTAKLVETGQTASASVTVCGSAVSQQTGALTMGYWQNKNGQALIAGANQAQLLAFLRSYAPFADAAAPLTGYATTIIKAASASGSSMNPMLKAQMLATAFDVYFSDPARGGNKLNAPTPIGGVRIDLTRVPPIGNTSAAFGGATSLTVSQILAYAAGQSNAGGSLWYGNVKTTQELAKDVFDAINNQWAVVV